MLESDVDNEELNGPGLVATDDKSRVLESNLDSADDFWLFRVFEEVAKTCDGLNS